MIQAPDFDITIPSDRDIALLIVYMQDHLMSLFSPLENNSPRRILTLTSQIGGIIVKLLEYLISDEVTQHSKDAIKIILHPILHE